MLRSAWESSNPHALVAGFRTRGALW